LAAAAILFDCGSHQKQLRQPVKTVGAPIFFFKALPYVRQYIYNRYSATHAVAVKLSELTYSAGSYFEGRLFQIKLISF